MPADYSIVMTRPCTDVPNRFIAESSFGRKMIMSIVCEKLKSIQGAKCSDSLGVAKLDYKEWTFILYRSGRIDLRKVIDQANATAAMQEMEQFLAGAFEGGGSNIQS